MIRTPLVARERASLPKRGMVLPLVLVALVIAFAMSASLQQMAWRAVRGATTHWNSQRALYRADMELARVLATWVPEAITQAPIGQIVATSNTSDGWRTEREIVRTAPLAALVRATTERDHLTAFGSIAGATLSGALGDATRVHREVWRALWLEPPAFPVLAAATFVGAVSWSGVAVDGRDLLVPRDPAGDDCGVLRDTLSTAAAAAPAGAASGSPSAEGVVLALPATSVSAAQRAFDDAWPTLALRARNVAQDSVSGIPPTRPWQASVIHRSGGVTVDSTIYVIGLLAIDGDLIIRGTLHVDGMLLVRGAIRVESGGVTVRGGLLVRDVSSFGSTLNATSSIQYAPCVLARALSAVAVPRIAPFRAWNSP